MYNNNQKPMYNQQPQKKSNLGCIIAVVIGILLLPAILVAIFVPLFISLSEASKANYDFGEVKVYIPEEWTSTNTTDGGYTFTNSDNSCVISLANSSSVERIDTLVDSLIAKKGIGNKTTKELRGHSWNYFELKENEQFLSMYWTSYNGDVYYINLAGKNVNISKILNLRLE